MLQSKNKKNNARKVENCQSGHDICSENGARNRLMKQEQDISACLEFSELRQLQHRRQLTYTSLYLRTFFNSMFTLLASPFVNYALSSNSQPNPRNR
jgi:hypothetical protein